MFDLLNPFKFIVVGGVILLSSIICFIVVYVVLIAGIISYLPFGQHAAWLWMFDQLHRRVVTLGDDMPWPLFANPYYSTVSSGQAMVPWLMPIQAADLVRISAGFLGPAYEAEFGVPHYAVDLSCPIGTPVYATHGGIVYHTGDMGTGKGVYVGLNNDHFSSEYVHLSGTFLKHGDVVQPGALIGYSGNTGQSTGPHLHYAVMFDYEWVDPTQFWDGPVSEVQLGDGRVAPLPPDAFAASGDLSTAWYADPLAGGDDTASGGSEGSYLLGGAMGQYFPSNPPPVPGDWEHRGIPYISGAQGKQWTVVYARRLSDAENHGNLRLYGAVIGSDGREMTGIELRAFNDAGLDVRTTTGPDGRYEFAGFGRGAVMSIEVVGDDSQRVYNLWFVHPSAGGHCSYEVVWRKQG